MTAAAAVTIVAAITRDRGLGRAGELLYRIGADMRRFKALTMGHALIMGRLTYQSLPNGPLPGRLNIVLTRGRLALPDGAVAARTPDEALRIAAEWAATRPAAPSPGDPARPGNPAPAARAMVIGGGEVYRTFMPLADTLELTLIDAPAPPATDTWLPPYSPDEWAEACRSEPATDPRTGVAYCFATYRRRPLC